MSIIYKDQRLLHMQKGDAYTWSKFYDLHGHRYRDYRYDVRVGAGVKLPEGAPDWLKRSAEALSAKRIDVVMEDNRYVYVVECKVNATGAAIGQLIPYVYLYKLKYNPTKPVRPMLISNTIDADLLITLKELKIPFHIV